MNEAQKRKATQGRKKGSVVKYRPHYNLVGERFGKVVVVEKLGGRYITKGNKKQVRWRCVCDCGREKVATTNNLCMGHSSSCGCMSFTPEIIARRANGLVKELSGFTEILGSYRRNARKRGLDFALSVDSVTRLLSGNCFYCGINPSCTYRKSKIPFTYNGIDRLNNDLGYTPENSVSCCKTCNRIKHVLSYEDFVKQISKIYVRHR